MNKVFVVVYEHRHGHDISVFASQHDADQSCWDTITAYRGEFDMRSNPNSRERLDHAIERRDLKTAKRLWYEATEEWLGVEECEVQGDAHDREP